jgi:hypothetical protein
MSAGGSKDKIVSESRWVVTIVMTEIQDIAYWRFEASRGRAGVAQIKQGKARKEGKVANIVQVSPT